MQIGGLDVWTRRSVWFQVACLLQVLLTSICIFHTLFFQMTCRDSFIFYSTYIYINYIALLLVV